MERRDSKAHWKLRALANVRRHSDSDIFVDAGRRSTRERLVERLEALPELQQEGSGPSPRLPSGEAGRGVSCLSSPMLLQRRQFYEKGGCVTVGACRCRRPSRWRR